MRQAVALFEETDTRDELGIGTIRDAFADELFPGTSVIQTRLRYALLTAWIYQRLESDRRIKATDVGAIARKSELALIGPLQESGASTGVIGKRSGSQLQRPPSSIYWLLLQKWGMFLPRWTSDEYHRRWDHLRNERDSQRRTDDRGVLAQPLLTWNAELPSPPPDFPAAASFDLRREEADFLRGRIADACRGSLLAHAATSDERPDLQQPEPWLAFRTLPAELASLLALARKFALLVQGAALAYNMALAQQLTGREELLARLEHALEEWAAQAEPLHAAAPSLDELWAFCERRATVTPRTREFLELWAALLRGGGYATAARTSEALHLVERRERLLKGSRSRFGNARALELWGGQAGTGLLNYRWRTVQQFLADLYHGLDGQEGR